MKGTCYKLKPGAEENAVPDILGDLQMKQQGYSPIKNNHDKEEKLKDYQLRATRAYQNGSFDEASRYYKKVLALNPEDYIAAFYRGMSIGWGTTLEQPKVEKAVQALISIQPLIPEEQKNWLNTHFCRDLYPLISGHYFLSWDRYLDVEDWTDANIGVLFDYRNTAMYTISCIDSFKEILYSTADAEALAGIGEYYCKACCDLCRWVIKYKSSAEDLNSIEFLGISAEAKKEFIDKFEEMVFEVRKYNPDFRRTEGESIYSDKLINRLSPPEKPDGEMALLQQNRDLGLLFDKKTDRKIEEWRKREQFWAENLDKREEYLRLCNQTQISMQEFNRAKDLYQKHRGIAAGLRSMKENKDKEAAALISEICQLERKILGKRKAREEISEKEIRINKLEEEREEISNLIETEEKQIKILKDNIEIARGKVYANTVRERHFLKSLGLSSF